MSADRSPFGRQLAKAMKAAASEAECKVDPVGSFHAMLEVGRAMVRARRSREEPTQ